MTENALRSHSQPRSGTIVFCVSKQVPEVSINLTTEF